MRLRPLKVKEPPPRFFSNLICQIGEISLTPAGANRHTAPRRIIQKFSNCHNILFALPKTDRRLQRKQYSLRRFEIRVDGRNLRDKLFAQPAMKQREKNPRKLYVWRQQYLD
jgi:hypothetical protein